MAYQYLGLEVRLKQWLERQSNLTAEQGDEELRARQEREKLELWKARVTPWYLPPRC